MRKAPVLQRGDKVAIVSLSSGTLGEDFCQHNVEIGSRRLEEMGLKPVFMPHALKGMAYVKNHPEKRAADLKSAFLNPEIKGIICGIGGDDTFRTLPYLLDDPEFVAAVKENPKLFTGYSDTTINHLMFYRLGMTSFYGPAFLTDFADIGPTMLPYTKEQVFRYLGANTQAPVIASPVWYKERQDFSAAAIGQPRVAHEELTGHVWLQGAKEVTGPFLGGCLESLYDVLAGERYPEEVALCEKYQLFPNPTEWEGKIVFLETSEEKPKPELFRKMLLKLKEHQVFDKAAGLLVGKPQDEVYTKAYQEILVEVIDDPKFPILYNLNFGHAYPRMILPYGVEAMIAKDGKTLHFNEPWFK
ncbi:S66 family peptidase [Enterococcus sp. LJL98]